MTLAPLVDILLQLGLCLAHVHVVKKFVICFNFDSHELWLASMTLALDMLHDLVIGGQLFFVYSQHPIDTVDGCVCDELLEVGLHDEVGHVSVEHNVVGHANFFVIVLVVLAFTDTVRKSPTCSFSAIGLGHFFPLRLVNQLMEAHIDKGLLVKELLLDITDHFLGESLYAKACIWLDQFGADGHLTALLHLSQVLIVLGTMLWV